jgi:hypothetical protein
MMGKSIPLSPVIGSLTGAFSEEALSSVFPVAPLEWIMELRFAIIYASCIYVSYVDVNKPP